MFRLYKESVIKEDTVITKYFMKYENEKYRVYKPTLLQKMRAIELKSLYDKKFILEFTKKKEAKRYLAEKFNQKCCDMESELQIEERRLAEERYLKKQEKKEQKRLKKTLNK